MDYFLKSSAIIVIYYLFYKLFLERETFFQSNRVFLFVGIVSALIIPLITIPIYTEEVLTSFQGITYSTTSNKIIEVEQSFDWIQFIKYIYLSGAIFFGIKFILSLGSLLKLIIVGKSEKTNAFHFIKTNDDIAPFSFFNYIVFNPALFKQDELAHIITHEKVHANQWHSFDVLLSQAITVVFWFNPFSWLYKKDLQQNLEFIADAESQEQIVCQKSYQKLLLKTVVTQNQLELANSFYNSLIKKRIIMLQKNKSKNRNQWKFALILPLIVAFVFTFQTKLVAQKPEVVEIKVVEPKENNKVVVDHDNIEVFIITKNSKGLDNIKDELDRKGVTVKFKNLKRNANGEITSINIDLKKKDGTSSSSASWDQSKNKNGIPNIHLGIKNGSLFVTNSKSFLPDHEKSKNVYVIEKKDGNHAVIDIKTDGNNHETIEIKIGSEHTDTILIKEDHDGNNLKIEFSDSENKPLILVDDKETSHKEMEKINPNKIESMTVLKDASAIKKYGDKGKNGVILITTKKNETIKVIGYGSGEHDIKQVIHIAGRETKDGSKPLIVIDGKISSKKIEDLDDNTIESVNVTKGNNAIKKYGDKGKHGVVEITTKKKK